MRSRSRFLNLLRTRTGPSAHGSLTAARTALTAAALLAALGLSGCSASPKAESQPPSRSGTPPATASATPTSPGTSTAAPTATAEPTPTYKPADANGPAQNVPLPVKPALADKFSKAGIEAFAKYWYATLSYGYETGNFALLDTVSESGCISCSQVKTGHMPWHQQGRWTVGGKMIVLDAQSAFAVTPDRNYQVILSVKQTALSYYRADHSVAKALPDSKSIADILVAEYQVSHWVTLTAEHISGKAE